MKPLFHQTPDPSTASGFARSTALCLCLLAAALPAMAQQNPAYEPVVDDPKLPRVLLIGDSISIGYTLPTRKLLQGKVNLHRIAANAGPTTNGLANIRKWLGETRWDVIHFNWGLHDLKFMEDGKRQVPLDAYERNLRELVEILKSTGATLIWAATTPVPEGKLNPLRYPADVPAYNRAAAGIMNSAGVRTNDLYSFALRQLKKIQRPENVHFTDEGSAVLATQVAAAIIDALPSNGAWRRHEIDASSRGADGIRASVANGNSNPRFVTGWEEGGVVRVYRRPDAASLRAPWPAVTAGRAPNAEDAVFVDLDKDGAEDVVSSCEGNTRAVFIHWAPKAAAGYWDERAWVTAPLPAASGVQRWMFALPFDMDGRNGIDMIAGGKGEGAAIGWFESPENPRELGAWRWHTLRPVGWTMSLIAVDMDGDGDRDILFSDRKGPRSGVYWLENPGVGRASAWREHLIGARGLEVMFATAADLDGDGITEVLAAVRPGQIHHFRRESPASSWLSKAIPLPPGAGTAKAVSVGDIDLDGRPDIVFSCEHATPPLSGVMWLSWPSLEARDISGPVGVKYDLVELIDLDQDGDLDILTTEETANLGVIWYENPTR